VSANIAQLQRDLLHKLLSEPLLADLNIVALRDLQSLQSGLGEDIEALQQAYLVWTTPRAGGTRIGCGVIIGMPTKEYRFPNVAGPERACAIDITTIEDPLLNLAASETSTGKTAEEWSDLIEAILHQFLIEALGTVYVSRSEPDRDIQGTVAYVSRFSVEIARDEIAEVAPPDVAHAAGEVTLTCSTPGAAIYYTRNAEALGSFPGPGNPAALLYSAPFAVSAGDLLRVAAYLAGARGSLIVYATID
jgi:hypothetical protein